MSILRSRRERPLRPSPSPSTHYPSRHERQALRKRKQEELKSDVAHHTRSSRRAVIDSDSDEAQSTAPSSPPAFSPHRDHNGRFGRTREPGSPITSRSPSRHSRPVTSFPVNLKIGKVEALLNLQGDSDPPFYGVLKDEDAETMSAIPTSEERHIFGRFSDSMHPQENKEFQIKRLHLGDAVMNTWYTAPYPAEYSDNDTIYLCQFCLKYMSSKFVQQRHAQKCPHYTPPGREIYRDGDVSVFEVDGAVAPLYCQNLCLLAKLFLDSKTLYYDVEPFLFYVLTKVDDQGARFVGYFSKEKIFSGIAPQKVPTNNVSCIVTLPQPENKGFGQFLISLSYLLSRTQHTVGTPEKPLSNLGSRSYANYWELTLCYELKQAFSSKTANMSIQQLSTATGLSLDDVVYGLETLGWFSKGGLDVDIKALEDRIELFESKHLPKLNPALLTWAPARFL